MVPHQPEVKGEGPLPRGALGALHGAIFKRR